MPSFMWNWFSLANSLVPFLLYCVSLSTSLRATLCILLRWVQTQLLLVYPSVAVAMFFKNYSLESVSPISSWGCAAKLTPAESWGQDLGAQTGIAPVTGNGISWEINLRGGSMEWGVQPGHGPIPFPLLCWGTAAVQVEGRELISRASAEAIPCTLHPSTGLLLCTGQGFALD